MPIPKEDCPECSTHTVTFNPRATEIIENEKKAYLKKGKRRSVEQIVNKIILQWDFANEHQKKEDNDEKTA